MRRLQRVLHLVRRFGEVARSGGLRLALSIARRKASRAIAWRWRTRVRASANAGVPADLADVRSRGCRLSVIVPVHDTPPALLRECVESVLAQVYPHWELCLCDDASTRGDTLEAIEELRGSDPRFRIVSSDSNLHIAGATNLAAEQATGKFLVFLDHDDVLHPWALYEVAKADLRWNDIDVLYTDEDKLDEKGYRRDPYYKPDWSPEHLDSVMYLLHMLVIRKRLFWRLGGMRPPLAGAQDYDLALRATRLARRVHHVDRILYHWRIIPGRSACREGVVMRLQARTHDARYGRDAVVIADRGLTGRRARVRGVGIGRHPDHRFRERHLVGFGPDGAGRVRSEI